MFLRGRVLSILSRQYSQTAHRNLFAMNKAYFRRQPEDQSLHISFRFSKPDHGIDRDFNFIRSFEEKIEVCLLRMQNNIDKEFEKKFKKRKVPKNKIQAEEETSEPPLQIKERPPVTVYLLKNQEKLKDVTFAELLGKQSNPSTDLVLQIIGEDYAVTYNAPTVVNLVLPTSIMAEFFLYPSKVELLFADRNNSKFTWFRGQMPKSNNEKQIEWSQIQEGICYFSKTEDIGYRIKIQCTPSNGSNCGPTAEYISKCDVQAGPGFCPFENRHAFTQNRLSGNEFRVVTYNILADLYADSDYTRKELFPYCPPYALAIEYRKQLFIKEILGYNSDIICLQEVDSKIYDLDLENFFNLRNYGGTFQKKGTSAEGIATFYDNQRFELVETHGINIGEKIPKNPVFNLLYQKIKSNEKLIQRIVDRSTAVQITVLRSKENGKFLIVANTHLYFHPDADHIRLLQIGFSMLYVEDVYKKILTEKKISKENLSILFCGDFNSVPECGIYKLLTEKFVPADFIDWQSNKEEAVKDVTLQQPFSIKSACGSSNVTNFTAGFQACIDYIFYQTDNLQVEEVIPFPSKEELSTHIAIPSVVFPSDHIALIANFKWI